MRKSCYCGVTVLDALTQDLPELKPPEWLYGTPPADPESEPTALHADPTPADRVSSSDGHHSHSLLPSAQPAPVPAKCPPSVGHSLPSPFATALDNMRPSLNTPALQKTATGVEWRSSVPPPIELPRPTPPAVLMLLHSSATSATHPIASLHPYYGSVAAAVAGETTEGNPPVSLMSMSSPPSVRHGSLSTSPSIVTSHASGYFALERRGNIGALNRVSPFTSTPPAVQHESHGFRLWKSQRSSISGSAIRPRSAVDTVSSPAISLSPSSPTPSLHTTGPLLHSDKWWSRQGDDLIPRLLQCKVSPATHDIPGSVQVQHSCTVSPVRDSATAHSPTRSLRSQQPTRENAGSGNAVEHTGCRSNSTWDAGTSDLSSLQSHARRVSATNPPYFGPGDAMTLGQVLDSVCDPQLPVILCFLRRFGCPVCRAVSTGLSYLKDYVLRDQPLNLIAIAIEDVGFEEFYRKRFFSAPVYINPEGTIFKMLELKRLAISNGYGVADIRRMTAAVALASSDHFRETMDFRGDLAQLGGLFILDSSREHFIMEFRESYAGDTPKVHDLLSVLNAPEDVKREYESKNLRVLHLAQMAIQELRQKNLAVDPPTDRMESQAKP